MSIPGAVSQVARARSNLLLQAGGGATGGGGQGQSLLPTTVRRPPLPQQNSRLTWTFAFCALFAMGSFFIAHVALSTWLTSEESLLERSRLSGFRRHQERHQQQVQQQGASAEKNNDPFKRILVLGSHHTGTSIVTKLIMESGAHAGNNLVMLPGNPLKYNENSAAVEADKRVMRQGHGTLPRKGPYWVDYGFRWDLVPPSEQQIFLQSVDSVIRDLEQGAAVNGKSAWVLKDPRMAILAEQWVSRTPNGICVLVTRNPIEASKRLAKVYNRGGSQSLSVTEWMEFWSESMLNALRACARLKRKIIFAAHADLAKDPLAFARKLERDIFGEVKRYADPASITQVLGPEFGPRSQIDPEDDPNAPMNQRHWTPEIRKVWDALSKQDITDLLTIVEPKAKAPVTTIPAKIESAVRNDPVRSQDPKRQAFATIVTGNDKGFVAGALALARSIRQFDSKRDLIAMLSVEVNDPTVRKALALAGWQTVEVQKLEEPWFQTHPKCRRFTESQVVRWGRMFSKLRVYSLPYDRILYLDTDVVVLRDPSPYFALPGDFYAERSPSHRGINAGILLIRPSEQVLEQLITYAREHEPMEFWKTNQVGCTEQELLNRFWNGANPANKLNNTRHFDFLNHAFIDDPGREENRLEGARLAHCLTTKCNKPWDVSPNQLIRTSPDYDQYAIQSNCDPLMYLVWYQTYLSPELDEARRVLSASGDVSAEALRPDPRFGLKEVQAELEALAGPEGINFRRNWKEEKQEEDNPEPNDAFRGRRPPQMDLRSFNRH